MKRKSKEELKEKSVSQLAEELKRRQEELFKLRLDLQTGKLKNTASIGNKADEIAVIKTFMRQSELETEGNTK